MALRTTFTETYGLQYPIVSAPMGSASGGRLAAAVSSAGGFGSFGATSSLWRPEAEWVRRQIQDVRAETDRPFAVGFITALLPEFEANFEVCLEEPVPVFILSFGHPASYARRAKDAGRRVFCQVQTAEGARMAIDAGADILIAQGNEAGGHSGELSTLPCLTTVLSLAGDTPVLAAGGIGNGPALAAVLSAGARGAMLGTAFLATPEAVEYPDSYKALLLASDGEDTVHTRIFDIIGGAPWPAGISLRARANDLTRQWSGRESELGTKRTEIRESFLDARAKLDPAIAPVLYGQAAGMIDAIRPAAEVMQSICDDAERLLKGRRPA